MRSPCYNCEQENRETCSETCELLKTYQLYIGQERILMSAYGHDEIISLKSQRVGKKNSGT